MTRMMMTLSGMRHRLALVGLGLAVSLLAPGAASAQFCLSQEECEDGLFCTDDICLGVCVRTTRNCGDLNFQCTADSCNESQNRCVHTVVAGIPCEDFDFTTLNDKCTAQGECKGVVTPPLACDIDVDCPRDLVCRQGTCEPPEPTRVPTLPVAFTQTRTATRTRTPTRTATRTATPTRTATRTPTSSPPVTPAAATPTETPSPTPSPDRTSPVPCAGDCNGDAAVGINELVLGVSVAQNALPISACPSFDTDGSGAVEISELIDAVSAALVGCG